jgi:hypothetical protein
MKSLLMTAAKATLALVTFLVCPLIGILALDVLTDDDE